MTTYNTLNDLETTTHLSSSEIPLISATTSSSSNLLTANAFHISNNINKVHDMNNNNNNNNYHHQQQQINLLSESNNSPSSLKLTGRGGISYDLKGI